MKKRLIVAVIAGAGLGIFCIIGIGWRLGYEGNSLFLLSAWFNRVVMGGMIGLAGGLEFVRGRFNWLGRGALIGAAVSFGWFLDTEFRDVTGFLAGVGYGVVIDWAATRYGGRSGSPG